MVRLIRSSFVLQGVALWVIAAALLLLWPDLLRNLLRTAGYMPHTHCYLGQPKLVWLHISSDSTIGLSYVAISTTLAYMVYRARQEIPFRWVFLAFGLFIVACGCTHFMEVVNTFVPYYWLSGYIKLITAVASLATAIILPPMVPGVLSLIRAARLSEQRRLELEEAHSELEKLYAKSQEVDQLKTQFFANVSHELRTPLTLILGPTTRMMTDPTLTTEQRNSLGVIDRNARSLLTQVNDLLDISKVEAGKMDVNYAAVDLAYQVRLSAANFETIAEERQIDFTVETPVTLPAQADPEKLQRILLNLLANAFKFTPDGGIIHCEVHLSETALSSDPQVPGSNEPGTGAASTAAIVEVRDSGPGVPAELREAIFERYQQAETSERPAGGTGLGLAIARDLVQLHGGAISVSEAPEGGAAFTIQLPLQAPADVEVREASSTEATRIQSANQQIVDSVRMPPPQAVRPLTGPEDTAQRAHQALILVVEDNVEMNSFIVETLSSSYRVVTAFDGAEGLQRISEVQPDAIISDIMMPRMSGDQLVREVRSRSELNNIPIILLSAKADDELRVRLLREGAQDYLMKPFFAEELLVRVEQQVSIKRTREVLQQELESQSQDINGLAREVTERKHELQTALEALRESEARLRRIFESGMIGIGYWNAEGDITDANDCLLNMVKYSREDLQSGTVRWNDMTPPEYLPLDDNALRELREVGISTPFEKEYIRKDGKHVCVMIGGAVLDGYTDRGVFFALDISERKRAERERDELLAREQTARAEAEAANRAKDEFLATLSHELRTPLQAILGWTSLLRGGRLDADTSTQALETIERSTRSQIHLVESILDVSRIVTGKFQIELQPVTLAPVIEAAITAALPAAEARNIEVRSTLAASVGPVGGNAERLQQVVWNLLSNAIKFNNPNGRVEIHLERETTFAKITVSDTGQGIAPEFLPHVFDRFSQADTSMTRQHGGLGLGLSIVRHLVELHGGSIEVQSPGVNQGATFIVRLPLLNAEPEAIGGNGPANDETAAEHEPAPSGGSQLLTGVRVVIVEDEADARILMQRVLEQSGATVIPVDTVAAAMAAIKEHRPHILVSDIAMPGEDGYDLIRQLRTLESEQGGFTPAAAITAHVWPEDRDRVLASGFQMHISKPVEPDTLIASVAQLANRNMPS